MKTTFRKSMIWLHTYCGVFAGWLLFAIFLTGTLSYYNQEITHWMTGKSLSTHSQEALLANGLKTLESKVPNATSWQIQLPDGRGQQYRLSYRDNGERGRIYIDSVQLQEREEFATEGGNFFRTFHYTLSFRQWGGRYLTGIAAMLMLVGVFTGIYTHRRFFKDFFTIRRAEPNKYIIDLHAILGVITIPFCFVISFSALAIYISMYQPFTIAEYFDSYRSLDREVSTRHAPIKAQNIDAQHPISIEEVLTTVKQQWGDDVALYSLAITNPSDVNAQLTVSKAKTDILSNRAQTLALTRNGELLSSIEPERTARMVRRVFYGLHEAHFATPMLRAAFFILGMSATLLIATGMVIWVDKRTKKQPKRVHRFVEKMNYGMFYGLTLAVAFYFLCSKLVVFNLNLVHHELTVFFSTWLASVLFALAVNAERVKLSLLLLNTGGFGVLLLIEFIRLFEALTMNSAQQFDVPNLTINCWLALTVFYFSHSSKKLKKTMSETKDAKELVQC